MTVTIEEELLAERFERAATPTPSSKKCNVPLLCDSGANAHVTPEVQQLTALRSMDQTCTFGNQGHLRAHETWDAVL